jgi:hypothetical protein
MLRKLTAAQLPSPLRSPSLLCSNRTRLPGGSCSPMRPMETRTVREHSLVILEGEQEALRKLLGSPDWAQPIFF